MLYKIARKIKDEYLGGLSFSDRVGGLVRTMNDNRKGEKSYPVEINRDKVVGDMQYLRHLVPDSDLTSVMYFEQLSPPVVTEEHKAWYGVSASLSLICWFNYQKVNPNQYDASYLIAEIKQAIPFKLGKEGCINTITCSFAGQEHNTAQFFDKYTYNEAETQFFQYPYEFFVLNFDVSYRVANECYEDGLIGFDTSPMVIVTDISGTNRFTFAGVSGREFQAMAVALRTSPYSKITVLSKGLYEFSGENQDVDVENGYIGHDTYFYIGYGKEYLRRIDMSEAGVQTITLQPGMRLNYIDLSDNEISSEADFVSLIGRLVSSGVENGYLDISGTDNSTITDASALADIGTLQSRGWSVFYNFEYEFSIDIANVGPYYGYYAGGYGNMTPNVVGAVAIEQLSKDGDDITFGLADYSKINSCNEIRIDFGGGIDVVCDWVNINYVGTDAAVAAFMQANSGSAVPVTIYYK